MSDTGRPDDELFDYRQIRHTVGFVLRAVRRHRALTAAVFVLIAGVGSTAVMLLPRTWHAEARLLANQNQIIRALGNPRSSMPNEDPTRAARETIFAHDNLEQLIKQTNLLDEWDKTRPFVVRTKDRLLQIFKGDLSPEERMDAMVGTLEKRLRVDTDQQTVTISIDWQDPQMAYMLVETAQQNFLETRHVTEMTAISEALSILEMHAAQVQKSVDEALAELQRVREARRKGAQSAPGAKGVTGEAAPVTVIAEPEPPPSPRNEPKPNAAPAADEAELAQLKFLLNSKRRALADLEDFRSRRVSELNAQLLEQKVQYADQHPIVLDTMQRIAAMKQDSPQIVQVKADIDGLIDEFKRKGGKDPDSLIEPPSPRARTGGGRRAVQPAQAALSQNDLLDDPVVDFARNTLRVASAKYEELMMRIDGARIEQDTARAAFKYRYSVVRPAAVPKKPVKPDVVVLLALTFMAAFGAALISGAVRDWTSGRFVEAWQVESALKLPVVSQVKPS